MEPEAGSSLSGGDFEWREAILDLARAQRAYAEIIATPEAPEALVNRAWLRLWRAERRRDELLGD
jgi:hypothetical protein